MNVYKPHSNSKFIRAINHWLDRMFPMSYGSAGQRVRESDDSRNMARTFGAAEFKHSKRRRQIAEASRRRNRAAA